MKFDQSAVDTFVQKIRPHGKEIGAQADSGNAEAKRIIELYQMFHMFPDPASMALCEEALNDWLKKKES